MEKFLGAKNTRYVPIGSRYSLDTTVTLLFS